MRVIYLLCSCACYKSPISQSVNQLINQSIAKKEQNGSFFLFLLKHTQNTEWPENRIAQGDTGIYNEYINLGVPIDQCMYIKDDECTKTNCQNKLELFLQQQQQRSEQPPTTAAATATAATTFVFYYGGHGTTNGFATIGGTWTCKFTCSSVLVSEKLT